jgi:hypothetical protein
MSAAAMTSSPKTSPQSSKPSFDVNTVEARSYRRVEDVVQLVRDSPAYDDI